MLLMFDSQQVYDPDEPLQRMALQKSTAFDPTEKPPANLASLLAAEAATSSDTATAAAHTGKQLCTFIIVILIITVFNPYYWHAAAATSGEAATEAAHTCRQLFQYYHD